METQQKINLIDTLTRTIYSLKEIGDANGIKVCTDKIVEVVNSIKIDKE